MAEHLTAAPDHERPSHAREAQEMPPPIGPNEVLQDSDFELLVQLADGELSGEPQRRAAAELLLERSAAAQTVFADLQGAKVAVQAWATDVALNPQNLALKADLSMVRGRVMARLPPATAAQAPRNTGELASEDGQAALRAGWRELLRAFGFGKASLALGAAALAAVVLLARASQPPVPAATGEAPAVASQQTIESIGGAPATAEPDVIIEELEVDSGSVAVTPGSQPSQPTVIWHFQGQGEG